MKKGILVAGAAILILSGCQLNTSVDLISSENIDSSEETTNITTTDSAVEDTSNVTEITDVIIIEEATSKNDMENEYHDDIEGMILPTDENGTWLEYGMVDLGLYKDEWAPSFEGEFGPLGVSMYMNPLFFIGHTEESVRNPINEKIYDNARMNYWERFQMKDLKLDIKCRLSNVLSRFVSYHFEGMIYHIGDDERYQDEKEYLYYMTIDRMTGNALSVDTVYGIDKVKEDILNGNYVPIRAENGVLEKFGNELLADIYVNEPLFDDDMAHRRDYYLDDAKRLNVVIWVGDDNGSYVILCLQGDVKLINEMDKSIDTETSEEIADEASEESIEETLESIEE